jgi:hypothetical protein
LFSMRCALFQVPYPVSPLLATLTEQDYLLDQS